MKLPKFLTRSKSVSAEPPESELCGMMREAIDATAAGSSPWHLKETPEIIDFAPLTGEEMKALRGHLSDTIISVKRDILKRKLTEVLTGATVLRPGTILNDVKRMGEPHTEPVVKVNVNPTPSSALLSAYRMEEKTKRELEAYEKERLMYELDMRNNYEAQQSSMQQMQNAQSAYSIPYEKRKL